MQLEALFVIMPIFSSARLNSYGQTFSTIRE
jgi:hypothetical protein